jgi:hypothetical protein
MWPDSNSFIDWDWGKEKPESSNNESQSTDSGESSKDLPKTYMIMVFEVEANELQLVLFQNALRRMQKEKEAKAQHEADPIEPSGNWKPTVSWGWGSEND